MGKRRDGTRNRSANWTILEMDKKYFRTTSFYPAAFLFALGIELVNIDKASSRRAEFVFADSPTREHLLHSYSFAREDDPEVLVDARKLVSAIKLLKEKLYQESARV